MFEFEGSTLYYFEPLLNRRDCGRAKPITLLLEDAGISFEYKRITFKEWPDIKRGLIDEGHRFIALPYLITKSGKLYTRLAPLAKIISKTLGKYIPNGKYEEYLVDAFTDAILDWRFRWGYGYFVNIDKMEVQVNYAKELESQYGNWEHTLGQRGGPYILGQEITYVDFNLYAMLREDDELTSSIKNYPNLLNFVKYIEARPSLQESFAQEGHGKKFS